MGSLVDNKIIIIRVKRRRRIRGGETPMLEKVR